MKFYLDLLPDIVLRRPQFRHLIPITEIKYYKLEKNETKKDINRLLEASAAHIELEYAVVEPWQRQICIDRIYVSVLYKDSIRKVLNKTMNDCKESRECCRIIENKDPPYLDEIKENMRYVLKLAAETENFSQEIMEIIPL